MRFSARERQRLRCLLRIVVVGGFILNLVPAFAYAQAPRVPGAQNDAAVGDPPAPIAPATIVRANGRVVVRAIHLSGPLTIDGKLDEAAYRDNQPIDGFIQTVPANGKSVTERTEAWVMYDSDFIYI